MDSEKNETNTNNNYSFFTNIITRYGLNHILCDEDGLYNGLIVPKSYANYLLCTSCLSLVSGLYGLYKEQYNFTMFPLGVFIASINYWIHPINNWRRYLDILYATFAIVAQSTLAYGAPNFNQYIIAMGLSCLCYPLSFYFQHKNLPISVFFHSLIHIGANIANVILYSDNTNTIV
jgi:hypothetical protein